MKIDAIRLKYDGQCAEVFIEIGDKEYLAIRDCGDVIDHWVNLKSESVRAEILNQVQ